MINQWLGNPIDGSMNNIFLRIHKATGIDAYPLLGIHSNSQVKFGEQEVVWSGQIEEIDFEVKFLLSNQNIWFWDIQLKGNGHKIDVIYGQDVGLADRGAVRNNEAYLSQYVDHRVFEEI